MHQGIKDIATLNNGLAQCVERCGCLMGMFLMKRVKARKLAEFMQAMPSAQADAPELTLEQINQLIHELRP